MGGLGSGDWNRTGRGTVEAHPALEAGRLRRAGALADGWQGGWSWRQDDGARLAEVAIRGGREKLRVRHQAQAGEGDRWRSVDETIPIRWRACPFGGERPFFLCPGCRRPVLKLHLAAARFRCRHCHRLTHAACREPGHQRALRRAGRLRRRLGSGPGELPPPRPEGMHRRTHARLACRIAELEAAAGDEAALLLLRLVERPKRKPPRSFWR